MKLIPNPLVVDVRDWPQVFEGAIDIGDASFSKDGFTGDLSKEAILESFCGAATLHVSGSDSIIFMLSGSVLLPTMIWPEEMDLGKRFRVSLQPVDGTGIPFADRTSGRLLYMQQYEATQIERI